MKYLIAIVVLIILAYFYAAYDLQFSYAGWNLVNGKPVVNFNAFNSSAFFSFPVPAANIGVYDSSGNFLGTVTFNQLQWINNNGTSGLTAAINPSTGNLLGIAAAALSSSGSDLQNLTFKGTIKTGLIDVPFNIMQSLN